jgi:hypothetical protein
MIPLHLILIFHFGGKEEVRGFFALAFEGKGI